MNSIRDCMQRACYNPEQDQGCASRSCYVVSPPFLQEAAEHFGKLFKVDVVVVDCKYRLKVALSP